MARGNDAAAATGDLSGQYGVHPNAEALIQAHRSGLDPALERASISRINPEATADLDLESIKPERGGTVLAASVRGGAIVYVAEGPDGRTYKGITPWEGKALPGGEDANARAQRASLAVHGEISAEAARINAEIEQEVERFRAKLQQEKGQELAEAVEQKQQEAQEAAEEAQREAESDDGTVSEEEAESHESLANEPNDPEQAGGPKQSSSEATDKATGGGKASGGKNSGGKSGAGSKKS